MTHFDNIRRQASDLEIDVEITAENRLNMQKRGATIPCKRAISRQCWQRHKHG